MNDYRVLNDSLSLLSKKASSVECDEKEKGLIADAIINLKRLVVKTRPYEQLEIEEGIEFYDTVTKKIYKVLTVGACKLYFIAIPISGGPSCEFVYEPFRYYPNMMEQDNEKQSKGSKWN